MLFVHSCVPTLFNLQFNEKFLRCEIVRMKVHFHISEEVAKLLNELDCMVLEVYLSPHTPPHRLDLLTHTPSLSECTD